MHCQQATVIRKRSFTGWGWRLVWQVDPADPRYKSVMCKHHFKGCCGHGDACSFAHSKDELRAGQVRGMVQG